MERLAWRTRWVNRNGRARGPQNTLKPLKFGLPYGHGSEAMPVTVGIDRDSQVFDNYMGNIS